MRTKMINFFTSHFFTFGAAIKCDLTSFQGFSKLKKLDFPRLGPRLFSRIS